MISRLSSPHRSRFVFTILITSGFLALGMSSGASTLAPAALSPGVSIAAAHAGEQETVGQQPRLCCSPPQIWLSTMRRISISSIQGTVAFGSVHPKALSQQSLAPARTALTQLETSQT